MTGLASSDAITKKPLFEAFMFGGGGRI